MTDSTAKFIDADILALKPAEHLPDSMLKRPNHKIHRTSSLDGLYAALNELGATVDPLSVNDVPTFVLGNLRYTCDRLVIPREGKYVHHEFVVCTNQNNPRHIGTLLCPTFRLTVPELRSVFQDAAARWDAIAECARARTFRSELDSTLADMVNQLEGSNQLAA